MQRKLSTVCLGLGLCLLAGCGATASSQTASTPTKRTIPMTALEYKGTTAVEKEPFPQQKPPDGGGYLLKAPEAGQWTTSTYRFEPGLIVVNQGDTVDLQIWGVNGASHNTTISGYDQKFVVQRGQLTTATFKADKAGIFDIICSNHGPSMRAQLLVLPAK